MRKQFVVFAQLQHKVSIVEQSTMRLVKVLLLLLFSDKFCSGVLAEAPKTSSEDNGTRNISCRVYLARSKYNPKSLGLFIGEDLSEGEAIPGQQQGGDMYIPLFDADIGKHRAWHELLEHLPNALISDDLIWSSWFANYAIIPGISAMAQCDDGDANTVVLNDDGRDDVENSFGVHRSKDSIAGSFTYRSTSSSIAAKRKLQAGQEVIVPCNPGEEVSRVDDEDSEAVSPVVDFTDLRQDDEAVCLDTVYIQPSQIVAGRGAFSKHHFSKGGRVTTTPVKLVRRSDLVLEYPSEMDISRVQLLQNYAFGHKNSSVLILPYGLGVNNINHAKRTDEANVRVSWSDSPLSDRSTLGMDGSQAVEYRDGTLLMDVIALRDISPGDELLMDYGQEWQKAWEEHQQNWEPPPDSENYFSASELLDMHSSNLDKDEGSGRTQALKNMVFTDESEGQRKAISNMAATVMSACYFRQSYTSTSNITYEDTSNYRRCLWPCRILQHFVRANSTMYRARFAAVGDAEFETSCDEEIDVYTDYYIPAHDVRIVDKPYTSDQFLSGTFRQEIGLPLGMFPTLWLKVTDSNLGDFQIPSNLQPGSIDHIRWKDDKKVVTPNAYLLGLSTETREVLLSYAEALGVVELSKNVTFGGNGLPLGDEKEINLQGMQWLLQATDEKYNSDMHWISPLNEKAQTDFLQALSMAGFDNILDSIGNYFDFEGLACYSLTFIAVSSCQEGFLHYDTHKTSDDHELSRAFNIIIPLLLSNDTEPELNVASSIDGMIGRLRYQYDFAVMMGDNALHATSDASYKDQVRLAATVYIADIGEDNVEAIMSTYTQSFPPPDRPDILLGMAASHWNASDPTVKLPSKNISASKSWWNRFSNKTSTVT